MLAESHLIIDLTVVVAGGAIGAGIARAFRVAPLIGYLLVGLVLGPSGFGVIEDSEIIGVLAELGVTLLLFTIGVELSLGWILRMRSAALVAAPTQIVLTTALGFAIARWMGWTPGQAAVAGFALALSSTMVVVKLLAARGELHTRHGEAMVAILLIQDLAAVVMVAAIPALAGGQGGGSYGLLAMAAKGIAFVIWVLVLARWIVPFVMEKVVKGYSREIFVVVAAGFCLGGAASGYWLGFSVALGAFAAGLVISESEYSHQLLADVTPLRDLFAMVFFVSLGLLWDIGAVLAQPGLVALLLVAVFAGKPLITGLSALLSRYHPRNAIAVGLGLAQIGEFSFLVATIAWREGLISLDMHSLIISVAGISLLATPGLVRLETTVYRRLRAWGPTEEMISRRERPAAGELERLQGHVILCGYGRVGRVVGEMLAERQYGLLVIDYDQHIAAELKARGIPTLYGDASSPVLLATAGADRARAAVLALPDVRSTQLAVRELRTLNPSLPIVARVHFREEIEPLYREGATRVVYAELEASLEMVRHTCRALGGTDDEAHDLVDALRTEGYRDLRQEPPTVD